MILCLETMFIAEKCPMSLANARGKVSADECGGDVGFLFPVFPQCSYREAEGPYPESAEP